MTPAILRRNSRSSLECRRRNTGERMRSYPIKNEYYRKTGAAGRALSRHDLRSFVLLRSCRKNAAFPGGFFLYFKNLILPFRPAVHRSALRNRILRHDISVDGAGIDGLFPEVLYILRLFQQGRRGGILLFSFLPPVCRSCPVRRIQKRFFRRIIVQADSP